MDVEFFVQNVKDICILKGTTPSAACEASGAGRNFMDNIKKGSIPSVAKVQQLADYLGVTTSELLGEAMPVHASDTVDRIFDLLDKMPIEQQEFAKLVGVSDDTASDWRRRRSASYTKRLAKISEVLGTSVEYLLTGEKKEPAPAPKNGDELDRDTIMAAFMGGDMDMSPEERDALWDDVYEYARFKAEQWRKKKDQE